MGQGRGHLPDEADASPPIIKGVLRPGIVDESDVLHSTEDIHRFDFIGRLRIITIIGGFNWRFDYGLNWHWRIVHQCKTLGETQCVYFCEEFGI